MPIRNPFARRPGATAMAQDENSRPGSAAGEVDVAHPGFERVDTVGSKASSALSIRSRRSQDTGEYKMSGMLLYHHKLGMGKRGSPLFPTPPIHLANLPTAQVAHRRSIIR